MGAHTSLLQSSYGCTTLSSMGEYLMLCFRCHGCRLLSSKADGSVIAYIIQLPKTPTHDQMLTGPRCYDLSINELTERFSLVLSGVAITPRLDLEPTTFLSTVFTRATNTATVMLSDRIKHMPTYRDSCIG